jgi:hypothetical protein
VLNRALFDFAIDSKLRAYDIVKIEIMARRSSSTGGQWS